MYCLSVVACPVSGACACSLQYKHCLTLCLPALLCCSMAGPILLHEFRQLTKILTLSTDPITKRSLAFNKTDSDLLAAAGEDGSVYVWSVRERVLQHDFKQTHRVSAQDPSHACIYTSCCGAAGLANMTCIALQDPLQVESCWVHMV